MAAAASRSLLVLAAAAAAACVAPAAAARPNIVVLILDDRDSLLGSEAVMPVYQQRFVEEGLTAPHAFVSTPKCCPSRGSLLSGRYAHRLNDTSLGWCGDFISADREDDTFMRDVKAAGYAMGLAGKIINDMGPMCSAAARVPAGFDIKDGDLFLAMCNEVVYYKNTFNDNGALFTTGESGDANYLQAFIGNRTIPWLERVAADAAAGGKPFFLYAAPHAPHFPATPAPWYADAPLPSELAPRGPSYNASGAGKSWAIRANQPLNDFTAAGIDTHFRNRLRSLMSVDDYVAAIFATLEAAGGGVLDNTFFIATSDHGYHLGEFRIPFEKSTIYETDVRTPFSMRGPGVAAGATTQGIVSLLDIGATVLELAGVTQPGERTTDGRSLSPLFAGGAPPASWRKVALIEHLGEANQWMTICATVFNASGCPASGGEDVSYLIDGPQNTWAMLRVANATMDLSYAEFRPIGTPPSAGASATNWTEAYDLSADFWQLDNVAETMPAAQRAALSAQLWSYANCATTSCP